MQNQLGAAKAEDLLRLRGLWRESFGEEHEADGFSPAMLGAGMESSLVLLKTA